MNVLVINCGSSSLKYQVINSESEQVLAKGLCERIGIDGRLVYQPAGGEKEITDAPMPTHKEAVQMVQQALETTKGEEVGQKQMMQAQIAIQAANALMTHNGNNLLANVLAQEAQDLYTQNYYNALADEEARRARESLRRSAGLSTSGSSTSNSNNSTSNNNNSSSLYGDLTKTAIEVVSMSGKSASQQ